MDNYINNNPIVFIVDDDYAVRDSLGLIIESAGFVCQAFESAEDFLLHFSLDQPCVLLLDINLPGMNGVELQTELLRQNITIPIIFITARSNKSLTDKVTKAGAVDIFPKPVPSKLLLNCIHSVFTPCSSL